MSRYTVFIITLLCVHGVLRAQEKSTGYSPPDRICKMTMEREGGGSANDLVCTVGFEDPSGDFILSRGETIRMAVTVRNYSEKLTIRPKIEILMLPDRGTRPTLKVMWTHRIGPGEMVSYTESIPWHSELLPCKMTYRFKAFDSRLNIESDTTDWSFDIQNEEKAL